MIKKEVSEQILSFFKNFLRSPFKKICNSTDTTAKHHFAFLKGNALFEVIQLWQRIKLFLEKIVEQDVSTIYSQILRNACETSLVFFFCVCSSKNVFHTLCLTWHICVHSLYLWFSFFYVFPYTFDPLKVFSRNYLLWSKKHSTDENIFFLFIFSQFC